MDRSPEAAGLTFWTNLLVGGMSRSDVLTGFSESPEHVAVVPGIIGQGFVYTLY